MSVDLVAAFVQRIEHLGVPGYGADEVAFLASILLRSRPTHVFEWGTNRGSSARIFAEACGPIEEQRLGLHYAVHTVELPIEEASRSPEHPGSDLGIHLAGIAGTSPIRFHQGDGLETTLRLADELAPERTLVFVDGDHSFATVDRELRSLATALPEALIVLHDTRHLDSVARAINEFAWTPLGGRYRREDLASQAGMTALWP